MAVEEKKTYFISGHLDLSKKEFEKHYLPQIEAAIQLEGKFIIGDANGADKMAQEFLAGKRYRSTGRPIIVTIYHMFLMPRNNVGIFKTVGGFKTDRERDEAMTGASDIDIAWVRPGRENSGTAKNIKRRQNLTKVRY